MVGLAEKIYEQALDLPIDDRLITRRCLTNKFPYGILYRIVENNIRIMAVMNLHRKPGYWKNR
jgi:hypothetical protein